MATVQPGASDAGELAEMLAFIGDWVRDDRVRLEELLLNFTGNGGYVLLHADLGWFCSCSATLAPACL
jgi:hypothetical protein